MPDTESVLFIERLQESHDTGLLPRTRAGKIKRRLSFEEKLQVLDPTSATEITQERLMAFINIFAFRTTGGIITRSGGGPRDWAALREAISPEQVARHLLADRLMPVFGPQWVGSRSPSTSRLLILDVDADRPHEPILDHARGLSDIHAFGYRDLDAFYRDWKDARDRARKKDPFAQRCVLLENSLRLLGIDHDDPRQVLKQPTPSGGLHYIAFLDSPYFLSQIHDLLIQAGLRHVPGQIEFFPSEKRALRLPFGHVPGHPHDARAWITFTQDYLGGRIRRHSLEGMYDRLSSCPLPSPTAEILPNQLASTNASKKGRPAPDMQAIFGISKARRQAPQIPDPTAFSPEEGHERYTELIENPITSFSEAEELFALGILVPGTRTAVLNRLAAHFIWFRHQSAEEATETLTDWAMNSRHQSKDIRADLDDGTGKVAKQIACMCRWYERTKRSAPPADRPELDPRARFVPAELDILTPAIQSVPVGERTDQAHFFLNLLAFAKQHGRAKADGSGWEVAVAINAVVRKWPGCRGKDRYKARMDRAKDSGLLAMTKDKWQRPGGNGRARTYFLSVPGIDRADWTVSYPEALARLTDPFGHSEAVVHPAVIDDAMPRSSAYEQSHEPTGTPVPHPSEAPDPRPLHPGSSGGGVGPRPPQCPSQPAPTEELPHRADEAVPALPTFVVPGPTYPNSRRTRTSGLDPAAGALSVHPSRSVADVVPFIGRALTDPELAPRLRMLLARPIGRLSLRESCTVWDFLARQRQKGAVIPDGVLVSIWKKIEHDERSRSFPENWFVLSRRRGAEAAKPQT